MRIDNWVKKQKPLTLAVFGIAIVGTLTVITLMLLGAFGENNQPKVEGEVLSSEDRLGAMSAASDFMHRSSNFGILFADLDEEEKKESLSALVLTDGAPSGTLYKSRASAYSSAQEMLDSASSLQVNQDNVSSWNTAGRFDNIAFRIQNLEFDRPSKGFQTVIGSGEEVLGAKISGKASSLVTKFDVKSPEREELFDFSISELEVTETEVTIPLEFTVTVVKNAAGDWKVYEVDGLAKPQVFAFYSSPETIDMDILMSGYVEVGKYLISNDSGAHHD